jgi:hypothetical protein
MNKDFTPLQEEAPLPSCLNLYKMRLILNFFIWGQKLAVAFVYFFVSVFNAGVDFPLKS